MGTDDGRQPVGIHDDRLLARSHVIADIYPVSLGGGDAAHDLDVDPGPGEVRLVANAGGDHLGEKHGFNLVSSPDGRFRNGDHIVLGWSPAMDALESANGFMSTFWLPATHVRR